MLPGNAPDFDLIATDLDGRSVPVQVKAIREGSWQLGARRFVRIRMDGKRQVVGALEHFASNIVCVLVVAGQKAGADRFFVMPMQALQKLVVANYRRWLRQHDGVRPTNPESTHCAVPVSQVERYQDNWAASEAALLPRQ